MSWQKRLDNALLNVDAKPSARLRNLRRVAEDAGTVFQDVAEAVGAVAEKGFKEGHVEAIDKLWPRGTIARNDLEGLQALRKQVPEVLEDLRKSRANAGPSVSKARPAISPQNLVAGFLELATDPDKQKEAAQEAKKCFPSYSARLGNAILLGRENLVDNRWRS